MTPTERQQMIASYGRAPQELAAAIAQFPREMWLYRATPDGWTIHEIVIHLADSEANSYVRCRRLVAEPGSAVLGYDEGAWATRLHYHTQNPEKAVALFSLLRELSHELIQKVPEAVYLHTIEHSENGPMSFDEWLAVYERHGREHIHQMGEIYTAWLSQKKIV